jgi:hypothetical protein
MAAYKGSLLAREMAKVRELKYFDAADAFSSLPNTGTLIPLHANMTQGVGVSNYIANQIEVRSVDVIFAVSIIETLSATATDRARVIIFQWHPMIQAAASPSVSQILQTTSNAQSAYSDELGDLYDVLYDETFSLISKGPSAAGPQAESAQHVRRFTLTPDQWGPKGRITTFQSPSGLLWAANGFYLLVIGDSASNKMDIDYNIRINYYDA